MIPIEAGEMTIPSKEPQAPSKPSPSYVEKQVARYTAIEQKITAGEVPYAYIPQAPTTTTPPQPTPTRVEAEAPILRSIIPPPAYHYAPPAFPSYYARQPYYTPKKYGGLRGYGDRGILLPLSKHEYERWKEKAKRKKEEEEPMFYLKFHGSPSFEITIPLAIATALVIAVLVILVLR